jgi:hypothetical protein
MAKPPAFNINSIPVNINSPKSPRYYKYSIADVLAKTVGTVAMTTVRDVYFTSAKYGYDRKGRITLYGKTLTVDEDGRRKHTPQFFAQDPHYSGRLYNCKAIMASCDCLFFLYFCEVAWWSKGLSEIRYSNGALPEITNPKLRIFCCKHLLRLGLTTVSKKF